MRADVCTRAIAAWLLVVLCMFSKRNLVFGFDGLEVCLPDDGGVRQQANALTCCRRVYHACMCVFVVDTEYRIG